MRRMCRYFTHFHSELFLYGAWLSSRRRRRRLPPSSPAFQFRSSGRCRKGTFLFLSTPANLEDPRFSMTISDGGNTAKHPPTQFDFQSMDCRISFSNILFSLSLSLFVEESGEFSLRKIARYEGGKYRFALSPVDNSISSFRLLAVFEEGRVR